MSSFTAISKPVVIAWLLLGGIGFVSGASAQSPETRPLAAPAPMAHPVMMPPKPVVAAPSTGQPRPQVKMESVHQPSGQTSPPKHPVMESVKESSKGTGSNMRPRPERNPAAATGTPEHPIMESVQEPAKGTGSKTGSESERRPSETHPAQHPQMESVQEPSSNPAPQEKPIMESVQAPPAAPDQQARPSTESEQGPSGKKPVMDSATGPISDKPIIETVQEPTRTPAAPERPIMESAQQPSGGAAPAAPPLSPVMMESNAPAATSPAMPPPRGDGDRPKMESATAPTPMPVPLVQTPAGGPDRPAMEATKAPASSIGEMQEAGHDQFPGSALLMIAGMLGLVGVGFGAFVFGRRNGSSASQPIALTESGSQSPLPLMATDSGGDVTGFAWAAGAQVGSGDGPVSDPQPTSVDGTGTSTSTDTPASNGFMPTFDESGYSQYQTPDGTLVTDNGNGNVQTVDPNTGIVTWTSSDGSSQSIGPLGQSTSENSVYAGQTNNVVLELDGGVGGTAAGTVFFGPDAQAPLFVGIDSNGLSIQSIAGQIDANGNASFSFAPQLDPVTGLWSGFEGTTLTPLPLVTAESGGSMDNVIVNSDGSLTYVGSDGQTTTILGTSEDNSATPAAGADSSQSSADMSSVTANDDGSLTYADSSGEQITIQGTADEGTGSEGDTGDTSGPIGLTDPVDDSGTPSTDTMTNDLDGGTGTINDVGSLPGGDTGANPSETSDPSQGSDGGYQQQTGPLGGVIDHRNTQGDSRSAGNSDQSGASDAEQGGGGDGPLNKSAQEMLDGFDKHPGGGTDDESDPAGSVSPDIANQTNYLTGGDSEDGGGSGRRADSSTRLTGSATLNQQQLGGVGGGPSSGKGGPDEGNYLTGSGPGAMKSDGASLDTSLGDHHSDPIQQAVADADQARQ
jgi:hypothetical protein